MKRIFAAAGVVFMVSSVGASAEQSNSNNEVKQPSEAIINFCDAVQSFNSRAIRERLLDLPLKQLGFANALPDVFCAQQGVIVRPIRRTPRPGERSA